MTMCAKQQNNNISPSTDGGVPRLWEALFPRVLAMEPWTVRVPHFSPVGLDFSSSVTTHSSKHHGMERRKQSSEHENLLMVL